MSAAGLSVGASYLKMLPQTKKHVQQLVNSINFYKDTIE